MKGFYELAQHIFNHIFNLCSDEGELMSSVLVDEDAGSDAPRRSTANPFLDVPRDKKASKIKEGLLHRKLHADVDGKRSESDERHWFFGFFPQWLFAHLLLNVTGNKGISDSK